MLHSAVGFLGLEGTIALYALIVAGPLLLAAALVWGLARLRKRREEQRLLTA
jgi:H+/gluconate symporter-like permease